ncbi:MAG: MerR family transcriptional regulator [Halobacteriovoraceae bacterium]|nr:MerR family transcriptional regulator [Halobacteriovoraceae bacterium]
MTNETFSIQFVSQITGINSHTIRAWEKRYNAVEPLRDKNQRRIYTQYHIDRLTKIHDLCSLGNNVSDIAKLNDNELEDLHLRYLKSPKENEELKPLNSMDCVDVNTTLQNLMLALNHYKLDIISHELEKAKHCLTSREFALNLIYPLLLEVGLHVSQGFITVGMEHAIGAIIKFHIGQMLYKKYQSKSNSNFHVVIGTPEGENDEFSSLISALLCCHYKVKFTYLGSNLSAFSLADAATQIKSDLVILSVSKPFLLDHKKDMKTFVQNFNSKNQNKIPLWIAGAQCHEPTPAEVSVECLPTLQLLDNKLSQINF